MLYVAGMTSADVSADETAETPVDVTPSALRFLVKEFGHTHRWVAEKIGLNKDQMSDRMRGKVPFSSVELAAIFTLLNIGWSTFGAIRDLIAAAGQVVAGYRGPRADSEYSLLQLIAELRQQIGEPAAGSAGTDLWLDVDAKVVQLQTLVNELQRRLFKLKYESE
jgi:hypothetical protein